MPEVRSHLIESKYVEQTYRIEVMQPLMRRGEMERYPVMYLTEGNSTFEVARGLAHGLQVPGQVRRFILVGICYPNNHPFEGSIQRGRDLTPPTRPEIPGLPRVSRIERVSCVEEGKKTWGGGADYLAFIRHELIPLIDALYMTLPGERAYFGHSLGGGLGLHALLSHPGIFNRYILSSPGICWHGNEHGLREAQQFIASEQRLDARVFMSVAEQEEFEPFLAGSQLVSGFYRLVALLRQAQLPGLELSHRVFPGETHASVWPLAFSHGVQAIYGPAKGPVMGTPSWVQRAERR